MKKTSKKVTKKATKKTPKKLSEKNREAVAAVFQELMLKALDSLTGKILKLEKGLGFEGLHEMEATLKDGRILKFSIKE